MALTPHVSRWRLCRPPQASTLCETSSSSLSCEGNHVATVSSSTPPISLRYLNEFVGKLHCAPALLRHELFPDAKEITESMALFNAVRRYIAPEKSLNLTENEKRNGIIVVGDGNTPRTAALFAFRMPTWTCYSVDPAMEKGTSERSKGWSDIANLVVIRNKIENVRIILNRAILVLVHAHVTLDQALSGVQAEQVQGLVTLPCCNWYGQQEAVFGRGPALVYDDFSILSDHRELRVWLGDEKGSVKTSHADLSLVSSVMKGCVRKEWRDDEPAPGTENNANERVNRVLQFLHDTFTEIAQDEKSEDEMIDLHVPSTLTSHIGPSTPVLALGWHPRRLIARMLFHDGYSNVYTISLANDEPWSGQTLLKLQLYKCVMHRNHHHHESDSIGNDIIEAQTLQFEPCGVFLLQSTCSQARTDGSDDDEATRIRISFDPAGSSVPSLACVFDIGFLYRGFRRRLKNKSNSTLFRHLCRTLDQLLHRATNTATIPSLVCLTLRNQWRKKEFLAHAELNYNVQSLIQAKEQAPGPRVYVFCCLKRTTEVVSNSKTTSCLDHPITRDTALEMYQTLEEQLEARVAELESQFIVIDSLETHRRASGAQEPSRGIPPRQVYAQASGVITRVRRFSNEMAFLLLAIGTSNTEWQRPLQLFLKRETLGWSSEMFTKVVRFLLRKGNDMTALGYMTRTSRGHSMLQVEAFSVAHASEFETYT